MGGVEKAEAQGSSRGGVERFSVRGDRPDPARRILGALAAVALGLAGASAARAADFEKPPAFNAKTLLGAEARGPNYAIADRVPSDGLLRSYTLTTSYGTYRVNGDQLLRLRLRELRALDALQRTSESQAFTDAVANAGLAPVRFAGDLVTNPVGTARDTLSGVGQLFGGVVSGVRNVGRTPEGAVASITGASRQKRILAFQYGVDPYTDFPPLEDKLTKLADAAAVGGLAVTGAFIAIPGAAGTVISNVSTADTLNDMVRDYTAAQLMDLNRDKLARIGVNPETAAELLASKYFTPVDLTVLVAALADMRGVGDLEIMADRAAAVQGRDVAWFVRRRVELTAAYQRRTGAIERFVRFGNSPFPITVTRDRGVVGIFPLDALAWTAGTAGTIGAMTEAARAAGLDGPKELRITGSATPRARQELRALGWTLAEGIKD